MDKQIERIVQNNPTLDGAEAITMTITRNNNTRAHYYIFKLNGDTIDSRNYIPIPFDVVVKINGKGKNRHYVIVAMLDDGYVVFDLNKEHNMKNLGFGKYMGLAYDEAEEMVKFQNNNTTEMPF